MSDLPNPDECDHRFIVTYGVTTADGGYEPPHLWACQECRLRFEPWKKVVDKERARLRAAIEAIPKPPATSHHVWTYLVRRDLVLALLEEPTS